MELMNPLIKIMASVTYKNQPAINKTKGKIPLVGNSHIYTVNKRLWNDDIESVLKDRFIGKTIHICCGKSQLGDVRVDIDNSHTPDIICDANDLSKFVKDNEYDTVLCDPPYNGKFQWNHDMLKELSRVSSKRIIFQHWFIPANKNGLYKKYQEKFELSELLCWQPKSYFGRVQMVSIFDVRHSYTTKF